MKYYLGIDLGGTNMVSTVVDEKYHIVGKYEEPTDFLKGYDNTLVNMAKVAKKNLELLSLTWKDIEHVGIGLPGTVDIRHQRLVFANNLGWRNRDVPTDFEKLIPKKTYIANDADCAIYGEFLAGAAKNYNNILMLTLGTGVGGGLIIDKKLYSGGYGCGIEPGHITIKYDGDRCTCDRTGCLEYYASATGLIRETIKAIASDPKTIMHEMCFDNFTKVTGKTAFDAARKGDLAAKKVVENYINYLSIGLSSYVTILRPEIIILGGGISNEGESLLAPIRKKVYSTEYAAGMLQKTIIKKAQLGNDAGLIGAAFLGATYQ